MAFKHSSWPIQLHPERSEPAVVKMLARTSLKKKTDQRKDWTCAFLLNDLQWWTGFWFFGSSSFQLKYSKLAYEMLETHDFFFFMIDINWYFLRWVFDEKSWALILYWRWDLLWGSGVELFAEGDAHIASKSFCESNCRSWSLLKWNFLLALVVYNFERSHSLFSEEEAGGQTNRQ